MSADSLDNALLEKAGCEIENFEAGKTIFPDGDKGDRMYIVRSGSVEVVRNGSVMTTVKKGGLFGEMAIIDGSPRSATARAKDDCELMCIRERVFLYLVHDSPYFALDVMRTLTDRLRAMNELI